MQHDLGARDAQQLLVCAGRPASTGLPRLPAQRHRAAADWRRQRRRGAGGQPNELGRDGGAQRRAADRGE
eukprot:351520-Chlamydomonas_euryale.AAC.3